MAEKRIKWTEQQLRAIRRRGSDVLVTASAGTGKTAVLSGRCVDILSDKSVSCDVLSVLVLTFTEAAAEQMRQRIAEQLRTAFIKSRDPGLRHQLMLLQGADIGTIHSFCRRLIVEYFYELGLDPTFEIIEADEQKLLKAEVLESTIDWAWRQSNLRGGLERLFGRRDLRENKGFLARIIGLNDFLDSVISRQNWYERALLFAEAGDPFTTELGQKQKKIIADKLRYILDQLRAAQKLYAAKCPDGDWADRCEEIFIKPVVHCIELLESGNWDRCSEKIRGFRKPVVQKPKDLPAEIGELLRKTVKYAVDSFAGLSELAVINPDYLDRVGGAASLQSRVLIELVRKFDQLYGQAKRQINCLDFADLERYALKLLTKTESSGDALEASETALALRKRYKYIFVDEYQDINPVQQAILEMLSCGDNVFVVGDVKQSIYAFRGAEPGIFLGRLTSASREPVKAMDGLRVDLNANWRSAKGILDFVNRIFGRIMTGSFTNIDYDESARLRQGSIDEVRGQVSRTDKPVVEVHILDKPGRQAGQYDDEGANVYSGRQCQATLIAQRIRQMVGVETGKAEFQIYDKQSDKNRDVAYRDIVILMRSPAKRVNDYVEMLRLAGVPVSCADSSGYFEKTEISDLLCLLKVLDNPQRDIELAGVLRSPFFNIIDSELAKIKIHSTAKRGGDKSGGFFYDCVLGYCRSGEDVKLAGKLEAIVATLERWRTAARRGSLADLIWQIYRETDFLSFVCGLVNGRQRKANLLKLHERAIQFEGFAGSFGIASLTRFVEFIERLAESGQDWGSAEPEAELGNAVRIMSVHKSKGLEFPVVFLAELNGRFNRRDVQEDCIVDADSTLGLQIIDCDLNVKLSSLAHQVIAEQKLSTSLAEEMRILYVALTRARQRLILSGCERLDSCREVIRKGFFFGGERVSNWQLRRCHRPLEWILYGLAGQRNLHAAFETGLEEKTDSEELFSLEIYDQSELEKLTRYIERLKTDKLKRRGAAISKREPKRTGTKLLSQVKKSLAWRCQFADVSKVRAKDSVTQLTHRDDEYVSVDYSKALARKPKAVLTADSADTIDSGLVGTAVHLVIARLDMSRAVTAEEIKESKDKLLADGAITKTIAERIDAGSIMGFFESQLGQMVIDAYPDLWREWPFTFTVPASVVCGSIGDSRFTSDETIIVQGIIDMLVRGAGGLVVIDFKTDNVTAEQTCQRAEVYREQLELYGRAAEAILKTRLSARWLYFLRPGCAVKV